MLTPLFLFKEKLESTDVVWIVADSKSCKFIEDFLVHSDDKVILESVCNKSFYFSRVILSVCM